VLGGPEWLLDQAGGLFVIDEALFVGVESQGSLEAYGDLSQVEDGAGAVAVSSVEGAGLAVADGVGPIGHLGLGLGKLGQFAVEVGDVGAEAGVGFSFWSFEEDAARHVEVEP